MKHDIQPIKSKKFLKVALEFIEPYKGTCVYHDIVRDYMEKTGQINDEYGRWLQHLLKYLIQHYNLKEPPCILDFGCGMGELTVQMNSLGFQATGIDVHEKHLALARILAKENDLPETTFVLNKGNILPFDDNRFDIITIFSVLEHLSDNTLLWLLPELNRICNGVIYVLVPNKLKPVDDHTRLRFVPWMPRWLATLYVKIRGHKHQYFYSDGGSWDVYYRSFGRIVSLFKQHSFNLDSPPDSAVYPSLKKTHPIFRIGKNLRLGRRTIFVGLPLSWKMMTKLGYPKEAFYPYLNLIFIPKNRGKL